ncbi:hypothetical protein DMH25_28900 [Streptomyces sp. WAC 01325]|uniref:DUF4365 domain-containing protein n=1 Tax=Streptomyces sp. WAC 01325 TaxID=2203202 RepID=UPI000F884F1C|nr:DUF4365 domain-containing protein [Streptomyces sp. WAC 01325]RSM98887.1 hypothetical protein DMH25_28900 [Streptomyces sp. WAC 01325]
MITRPKAAPAQSRSANLRSWHPACMSPTAGEATPKRKRLRNTRRTERDGVNALRAFLEDRDCVVQEVDAANDFGKDLLVDLTKDHEITGEAIAIQVKSGGSFSRGGRWGIPASSVDLRTWYESSTPIYGVIFDPAGCEFHWINLSSYVHERMDAFHDHKNVGKPTNHAETRFKGHFVPFPEKQTLTRDNWENFADEVRGYVHRFGGRALLDLMSEGMSAQISAVHDCFALGRGDARALLLLRHTITKLSNYALAQALHALSHCASNPDIPWSERNWIPRNVTDQVRASFDWSPEEILHMIREVEETGSAGVSAWERGGYGQSLVVLLWDSPDLCERLHSALLKACRGFDGDLAFRTLILYQYFLGIRCPDTDLKERVESLVRNNPILAGHSFSSDLLAIIEDFGWADIF